MTERDVIVAGGGHNGLVCAALLARAGLRTLLVERRDRVGGILDPALLRGRIAAVELTGRLAPQVISELDLAGHGYRPVEPAVAALKLSPDRPPLALWADPVRTAAALPADIAGDAAAFGRFDAHLRRLAGFVGVLQRSVPPRLDGPTKSDLAGFGRLAMAYRRLGAKDGRELTRALPMAIADLTGESLGSDDLRAAVAVRGVGHVAMGPWSAGTSLVLLNDSAAGGGAAGRTVFAAGGPGALARSLESAARACGVEIRTGAAVAAVLTGGDGAVTGVRLESGEELRASAVACGVDPRTVLTGWLDPEAVGPRLRWRAANIRIPGAAARVAIALSRPPAFTGVDDRELLQGRISIAGGIDDIERCFDAWKYGRLAERPLVEATIPTLADPSRQTGDGHLLAATVQWVPPGSDPDAVGRATVAALAACAPGFESLVESVEVLTPDGLEREYGLAGGHLHHGELALDQFYAWRPVTGLARHRLALRGLYLCGSGAHPGGGITGLPGRNAAGEILRDLRRGGR